MAVKQMQDQKKALQDQIKSKEMELQDLRKKLAELG
jgi:septal ring factor EnvC (AmiA/AmiB activator)